ncbi:Vegetative incompatibility HET-E-1 [Micractinium conductrix]|uniref:Vegetative incompatibility HET-E-1 n=1 Tax=Micractinium conductrix TaxID=554055 RepID=A0A2P6VBM4_9CHLO|nr:Vegetative incompatibility HET-E-1 [Micractinium conductrix]|eukprot:PSC71497.1 Vegetative incompatibility HET-E-1 [Micractinium conductrix]
MGGSNLGCPAACLFPEASSAPPTPKGGWQQGYRDRTELEGNWAEGRCAWRALRGHRDYIRCAQLAGGVLATCSGSYMHTDCSIRLWDVASGSCMEHLKGHAGPIWSMHWDGRRVASCDDEGGVRVWDPQSHRVGVSTALAHFSLKSLGMDATQLVVGGEAGALALWSLADVQRALDDAQQTHDPVPGGEGGDEDEGEGGAGGAEPRRLPSWQAVDLEGGDAGLLPSLGRAPQQPAGLPLADISCLQVDCGLCATGEAPAGAGAGPSVDGVVRLWGTDGDELEHRGDLAGHGRGVSTLSFQHSTGWLVAGSGVGTLRLWDLGRATQLRELSGHTADVLCHQQAGARLASGSADRTVRLWDLRAGDSKAQHVLPLGSFPYSMQMDDRRLAVGCANGMVQLLDLRCLGSTKSGSAGSGGNERSGGSRLRAHVVLPAHRERVWALALSDSQLISASLDSSVLVRSFSPADLGAAGCRRGWQQDGGDVDGSSSEEEGGSAIDDEDGSSSVGEGEGEAVSEEAAGEEASDSGSGSEDEAEEEDSGAMSVGIGPSDGELDSAYAGSDEEGSGSDDEPAVAA